MNFYDFTQEELEKYLIDNGFKKYNAIQIIEWVFNHGVNDFEKMSNLSKKLIEFLNKNMIIELPKVIVVEKSPLANKYLLELNDGNRIESVLMKHDYGFSICISSQVGCNMGCAFCESGRLKKIRDLTLSELIGQIICISSYENIRPDSIVVMGIGEPFDNFKNIKRFISVVTNNKMLNIGQRHITISTCGIVSKIYEFADLQTGVNLAISLHASNAEIRDKIMKINHAYKIKEIFDSIDYYIKKTNRRVTIEYIMLDDINDSEECAKELVNSVKDKLVYVNLIPYNETSHIEFKKSDQDTILKFYDTLKKNNIGVTIRREFGKKVSAACGQLRANYKEE